VSDRAEILTLAAQIVSAHVGNNHVQTDQVSKLLTDVHRALSTAGHAAAPPTPAEPAVPVKRSVFPDHVVCLECGEGFRMLKRHLNTDHQMSVDGYRQKWGLPLDYPMVAPEYAAKRSALAKKIGLGLKRPFEAEAPAKRGRGRLRE
jgi:predicted transcriptional regulator